MDTNKLKAIIIVVLALFASLYLGITAATAQFETVMWVIGVLTLIVCLLLGRRVWLLIPFMGAVNLGIRLPGQPNTLLIAQGLVIGFSVLLLLMRRLPFRLKFTELEFWILLLTLFVIQVYARNPVGIFIFGGDTVGGKPYALYGISLITALLLAGLLVAPRELKLALRLSILGGLLNFGISIIGRFVPTVGYYLGKSYVDTSVVDYSDFGKAVDTGAATRESFLGTLANNLSLWICIFKSPLRACFHPLWAPLVLISFAAAAMSGFRNAIAAVGCTYFVGLCYRGGFVQVMIGSLVGLLALAMVGITNALVPLPPNVQRSLTFLPGTWDERYVLDAENSTEWRVELWKEALLTDRWISNKMFGDGLGFTMRELQYQMGRDKHKSGSTTLSGFDAHRDAVLANGNYHSGPVQTIRTIGYSGLLVLLLFQIRLAVHAHRQISRCRGTEWFPVALFIGIPLIWAPIYFVIVFGTFAMASAQLLLGAAMVRMLQNNLPLPAWEKPNRIPYIMSSARAVNN
jgi:hypothetical protein